MKKKKSLRTIASRITAGMLAAILICGTGHGAYAAETPSEKEEIVYAMLDADGTVTGVYVVNTFAGGDILDYGDYTSVRNMTTTDAIQADGDRISLHTDSDGDKVYYQGNLESTDIPWTIALHYYIDGTEYEPDELAGMSGALRITISITRNPNCDERFWEGYALQATLLLDAEKCTDIQADGATIANVAADKQLSYILLPGTEKELEITANVTDFEMEAITINGVKLNLDLELESDSLEEELERLQEAVEALDDGALQVRDGADSLDGGVEKLTEGVAAMQTALETLNAQSSAMTEGSEQIDTALKQIQTALHQVSFNVEELQRLSEASEAVEDGLDSLIAGLRTMDGSIDSYYQALSAAGLSDPAALAEQNTQAAAALGITETQRAVYAAYAGSTDAAATEAMNKVNQLAKDGDSEAISLLKDYQAAETARTGSGAEVVQTYLTTAGRLIQTEALLKADAAYIQGSNQLISGIDATLDSNRGELMTGALELQAGYAELNTTIQALTAALNALAENMESLRAGVDTLTEQYGSLDAGIDGYTGGVAAILSGYRTLYAGTLELANGSGSLADGAQELYDGTREFQSKTENIDTELSDAVADTVETMTGQNIETISFVSEKNTKVDSVLFVLKTQAIEMPDTDEDLEEPESNPTVWQRFLRIFGLGETEEEAAE